MFDYRMLSLKHMIVLSSELFYPQKSQWHIFSNFIEIASLWFKSDARSVICSSELRNKPLGVHRIYTIVTAHFEAEIFKMKK